MFKVPVETQVSQVETFKNTFNVTFMSCAVNLTQNLHFCGTYRLRKARKFQLYLNVGNFLIKLILK